MVANAEESSSASKKETEDKPKKSNTTLGLGKRTFEFTNRKDKAEKIAEAPLWEKLIPKDGGERLAAKPVEAHAESVDVGVEEVPDAVVENLSPTEKTIAKEMVEDERVETAKAELETAVAPEEVAELTAVVDHYEQRQAERVALPEEPADTVDGADIEADQERVSVESGEPSDGPAELEHGLEIPLNTAEQEAEDADGTEVDPTQPLQVTPVPPVPMPTPRPGTAPNPNTPPAVNQPPTPPNVPPNGPTTTGNVPNFNAAPNTPNSNPNTLPPPTQVEYVRDRRSEGSYFLAGGILGYMLGRRRGRIKTEKRMNVVKQKLEKQIDTVRQEVVRQETVIREQARQTYNLTHAPSREQSPVTVRGTEAVGARSVTPVRSAEAAPRLTQAEVASNQRQAAEKLGITTPEAAVTAERIQRFDHREVLAIAEKVTIDGTSLRTIYESKQITEPGLRRITREFLRGGDVKAALQAEIQVKEMQYERDPQMRDRLAASYAGVDAAQPLAASDAMASLLAEGIVPKPAPIKAANEETKDDTAKAKARNQQLLVSAWAVLVVVLVITAVLLAAR